MVVWDATDFKRLATHRIELRAFVGVLDLDISPDKNLLAIVDAGVPGPAPVRMIDTMSGRHVRTIVTNGLIINAVAFSPDGLQLATGSADRVIRLWDVASGKLTGLMEGHHGRITDLQYAPDGSLLASASEDATVRVWNFVSRRESHIFRGHTDIVECLDFSPDGSILASGGADSTVRTWSLAQSAESETFRGVQRVERSQVPRSFLQGLAASAGGLAGDELMTSVALAEDNRLLVCGASRLTAEGAVRIWDLFDGHEEKPLPLSSAGIVAVALSRDGAKVAAGVADLTGFLDRLNSTKDPSQLTVWDLASRKATHTLPHLKVTGVTFLDRGERLASCSMNGDVQIWDLSKGVSQRQLNLARKSAWSIAYSAERNLLAVGFGDAIGPKKEDGVVRVWDVRTGDILATLPIEAGNAFSVAFSPDGGLIAAGAAGDISGIMHDRSGEIRLWETRLWRPAGRIRGHENAVRSLAFSPNGRRLLSASVDGTAKLWDIETGRELVSFDDHRNMVFGAAFSPDGQFLATASVDGTVKVRRGSANLRQENEYQRRRIASLIEVGRLDDALPRVEELIRQEPNEARWLGLRGVIHLRMGRDLPAAVRDLEQCATMLSDADSSIPTLFDLALAYRRLDRDADAVRTLNRARGIVEANPGAAGGNLLAWTLQLAEAGFVREAHAALDAYLRLAATDVKHRARIDQLAWEFYSMATRKMDQGSSQDASQLHELSLETAKRLVSLDPKNPKWLTSLGGLESNAAACERDRGDLAKAAELLDQAVAHLESAVTIDPKFTQAKQFLDITKRHRDYLQRMRKDSKEPAAEDSSDGQRENREQ